MATLSFAWTRVASAERRLLWSGCFAVLVVLVAFGLRIYAVGWGLPYTDHPDEPSAANRVLGMIRRNDWNPQFFGKPSLYYYALRLVFDAQLRYGSATGEYTGISSIARTTDQYLRTPDLFIWGRFLTVILGTLTVWLIYAIGRRWWDHRVGLLAAALLAALPYHMRNSQYITQDVPSALMALVALGAALRLLDHRGWRAYALAGITVGLAASTKYNAVVVALAVIMAHVVVWGRASVRQFWRLSWAGIWSLIGFVLTTPYSVLKWSQFSKQAFNQYQAYAAIDPGDVDRSWPILSYFHFFWNTGLQPLPFIAALIGGMVLLSRRDRAGMVVLAFVLPYPLFFLPQQVHFFRNMLPILPPLALMASYGVVVAATKLTTWVTRLRTVQSERAAVCIKGAGVLLLAVPVVTGPLLGSIELTRFYAQPDSRVRVGAYIRDHLPHGAPIAVALNPRQWVYQPLIIPFGTSTIQKAAWYRAQGYRYVVVDVKDADPDAYQALRAEANVLAVFPGDREGQPGPHMEVLDLGQHLDELAIERQTAVFGDQLRLLGFQRGAGAMRAPFSPLSGERVVRHGQALLLNLYWQPLKPVPTNYALFLRLYDARGQVVAQRDTVMRVHDDPSSHWKPGELVVDLADLYIPPDLKAGEYWLDMGVYQMKTMERLSLPGTQDGTLLLTTVTIR